MQFLHKYTKMLSGAVNFYGNIEFILLFISIFVVTIPGEFLHKISKTYLFWIWSPFGAMKNIYFLSPVGCVSLKSKSPSSTLLVFRGWLQVSHFPASWFHCGGMVQKVQEGQEVQVALVAPLVLVYPLVPVVQSSLEGLIRPGSLGGLWILIFQLYPEGQSHLFGL